MISQPGAPDFAAFETESFFPPAVVQEIIIPETNMQIMKTIKYRGNPAECFFNIVFTFPA